MAQIRNESAVKERYAAGAAQSEAALCCPVEYDPRYLKVIPAEVIEKDYGCGDPSQHVHPGETVLDLGSGTGKICFIASQVVGPTGRVIGVDMTDAMLDVARRNAPIVAERLGYDNCSFRKGRIQDLALDLDALDQALAQRPITSANDWMAAEELAQELRITQPLIASNSVDVVVSNCVLNLVDAVSRKQLFSEIYRVLKNGGRAVISDIVCDEDVPSELQDNALLWSGCISGAFREDLFVQAFEEAGFHGVEILKLDATPWQTVRGIEFRSMTIQAHKGKEGPCVEKKQAVIYKGPFKKVLDDDGHAYERGKRYAVCEKTYQLYMQAPYTGLFEPIDPREPVSDSAAPFDCSRTVLRHPKETKGQDYDVTIRSAAICCGPDGEACC